MSSVHSIEQFDPVKHQAILSAVAMEGIDVTPTIENAQRLIGYGDTKHGYGPACLIDLVETPYVREPHVTWFPWTSRANKIVNFKWAMKHMSETHQVLLNVEKQHSKFFEHFVRRGLLRKVGVIIDLPIVEEIHMYQVKRRKK